MMLDASDEYGYRRVIPIIIVRVPISDMAGKQQITK